MNIQKDNKGQKYIEWAFGPNGSKRVWIQHRTPDNDWAQALNRRYLNIARIEEPGTGPAGNATDFPIFNDLPDDQILIAFVSSVSSIIGCKLEDIS